MEGTYYVNRLFATVEMIPKTIIEVGNVGVVVSYTGEMGADLSGKDYRHGELASKGNRGVWSEALLPGKYAFNTYAGKVISVPTTNFILKWIRGDVGAHKFDENLTEVSLITKDAFEPSLPLSVVVHIDYQKAPLVIQRFGDVKKLVEKYRKIFDWDVPDIDQAAADRLILSEVVNAVRELEIKLLG